MNVMAKLRDALPLILLLGFAIVCLTMLKVTGVTDQLNFEQLRQWVLDATLIGILPGVFVLNYLGHSLRDIDSRQFYVAIAVYVVFAIVPLLYKRMKHKKPQN